MTMTLEWLQRNFNKFPAEIKNDKSRREFCFREFK